jgi:CheY-like chemotaxis protein
MTAASPAAPPPGRRIFLVEDEIMIRMLLEDMIADLGHEVKAVAGALDDALKMARDTDCDGAILDVNLNGVEVYAVADILLERGIPFAFATGYGERGIPQKYRGSPTLQKPFQRGDLELTLARAFAAAGK